MYNNDHDDDDVDDDSIIETMAADACNAEPLVREKRELFIQLSPLSARAIYNTTRTEREYDKLLLVRTFNCVRCTGGYVNIFVGFASHT